jgi:hypothetical protein
MTLTFLPTLSDMREMLGERLYVEFVWMWREQEQQARVAERRARWAELLPARQGREWPQPLVARVEESQEAPQEQRALQVALLHPTVQRLLEQKNGRERRLELSGAEQEPDRPREAMAGGQGRG